MTDVIIIGGGPAGLSAAVYAKRAGLSALVLDKGSGDCQLVKAVDVENYLGFESISGMDLQTRFVEHAEACGVQILRRAALAVEKTPVGFKVSTRKDELEARYVVIAVGRSHKKLGAPGEERFSGVGVSYCATCDGYFFKDKDVAVVGGGDSALSQAIYLSGICKRVYLVHRRDKFRAAHYLVQRAAERENIELVMSSSVTEITGDDTVSGVILEGADGDRRTLPCSGVFCAVGEVPNMKFSVEGLELDERGLILTDAYGRTNISGLYAAGDIRKKEIYQVVSAVSDGALVVEGILRAENGN